MNVQRVQVTNSSNVHHILVSFTPPGNAHVSNDKSTISISPNSTKKIDVQGGVMNMSVWKGLLDSSKSDHLETLSQNGCLDLVWKGVVPTKINNELVVNPKERKIFYDGMELPSNFQTSTNHNDPGFSSSSGNKRIDVLDTPIKWLFIILILIIFLVVLLFLYRRHIIMFFSKKK